MRSAVEAEKSKVRELEDLLQAMRAKEHAAVNAEQAAVVDSVGLHQRLQTALNENEKNVQVRTCPVLWFAITTTWPMLNHCVRGASLWALAGKDACCC